MMGRNRRPMIGNKCAMTTNEEAENIGSAKQKKIGSAKQKQKSQGRK